MSALRMMQGGVLSRSAALVRVLCVLVLMAARVSLAQAPAERPQAKVLGAGAPAGSVEGVVLGNGVVLPPAESHAWFAVPGVKDGGVVMHIPPRKFARVEDGKLHGSDDGMVRVAVRLDAMPSMIAAWGDRLYLLEDRPRGFERTRRLVTSLRAVRSGIGDFWGTLPGTGLDAHPSVTGAGEVLSFVASGLGPTLLLADRDATTDRSVLRLLVLVEREWVELSVPKEASEFVFEGTTARGGVRPWATLVSSVDGYELLCGSSASVVRWSIAFDQEFAVRVRQSSDADVDEAKEPGAPSRFVESVWKGPETLIRPGDSAFPGPEKPLYAGIVCGRLMVLEERGLILQMKEWTGRRWRTIESYAVESQASFIGVAPLDGVGRLAIVAPEPTETSVLDATAGEDAAKKVKVDLAPETKHQMLEVSVFTGREMFSGRWKQAGPLSSSDLRALAIVLIGAMSLVVVFVLKAESIGAEATLPTGAVFAGPIMRSVAMLIDFAVALLISGRVHSMSLSEMFSPEGLLLGNGVWAIVMALAIAAVVGTIAEATFGRTLGKLVTGCEVIDSRVGVLPAESERDPRPSVVAAGLRNFLKWMLPPIGLLTMLDPQGRHPADRLARTAVVVWMDDSDDSEDES
jgi:hypothetical protein